MKMKKKSINIFKKNPKLKDKIEKTKQTNKQSKKKVSGTWS
jgi:hypothetical protein